MSWDRIVGQKRVQQLLQRMHEHDRIPHALLFYGQEGSGKDAVALEFARVLNCEGASWNACGSCPSCRAMDTLQHPRLKLIFALPAKKDEDGATDKLSEDELDDIQEQIAEKAENPYHRIHVNKATDIKISSIRGIRKEAAFRAKEGGRTVVVISEADRMNRNSANALLKTLEEPGGDLLLILTTSRKDSLLPTIISRCQLVRFDLLGTADIRDHLHREPDVNRETVETAAHLSAGNYRAALEMAREDGLIGREAVLEYIRSVVLNNPIKLMDNIQQILGREDRQTLSRFLTAVASWFRDVMALREGVDSLMNSDFEDALRRFSEHYPDTRCSAAIDEIERSIALVRKNVHLTTLMIVLSQRLRKHIVTPANEGA
ncbi:MAG: DNA polymerase III subunit delta' [Ignavibacteria bacterium]|nr:MAG: DNA polymerase III subunit delta' [Ignavibacteria bacterium]